MSMIFIVKSRFMLEKSAIPANSFKETIKEMVLNSSTE